jgi:2-methylisocitrate lyase-like PEP mutase family enzyme
MTTSKPINCMKCIHFYVTWDPKAPRGCKAFGFKTSLMPSTAVAASSGQPCLHFADKTEGLRR